MKVEEIESIEFFGRYNPYWLHDEKGIDIKNSKFDNYSGLLLDLKEGKKFAIEHFFSKLKPLSNMPCAIAIVPSHNPKNKATGIKNLADLLCDRGLWLNATTCLQRYVEIPKLASGGLRDINVHMKSIVVIDDEMIKDKDVFLLDDVTTTGNSLLACSKLLEFAGAKSVKCYALGKTQWN